MAQLFCACCEKEYPEAHECNICLKCPSCCFCIQCEVCRHYDSYESKCLIENNNINWIDNCQYYEEED